MSDPVNQQYDDTGERILPTSSDEISLVYTRHKFAYESILSHVAGKTILDVGCGSGYGAAMMAESAKLVYGIDASDQAIAYCQQNFDRPNLKFIQMDGNDISLDIEFDVTLTFQAIEHMVDLDNFVEQLKRTTKLGGKVLISTPNVIKPMSEKDHNPFHVNEMNYKRFEGLIENHFSSFEIIGIAYARRNRLRSFIGKSPIYKWGKILGRKSKLKKVAAQALDLASFCIINENVENDAADLLAICRNNC